MLKISCSGHNSLKVGNPHDVANFLLNDNREVNLQPMDEPSALARQAKNGNNVRCRIVRNKSHVYKNVPHKCYVASYFELKMLYQSVGRYE